MGEIWSIVLAAGESRRMGFPKMLLFFNGFTMIENVISNIYGSEAEKILVVLGAERETIAETLRRFNVSYCYNEEYKKGMLSSVKCGFNNLPQDFRAALVFQGDQPMITAKSINAIINAYISTGKGIVIPVFKGKRGHPILIDRRYVGEIQKLNPDIGLHELAQKFSQDVMEIETNEGGILRDFDTYEEYLDGINQN